ncbi:MAG: hypothetical protein ACYC01_04625 [Lutibacter sp.]
MKQILFIGLLLVVLSTTTSFTSYNNFDDIIGEVIWESDGCDFYIIETNRWFVLVELYNGRLNEGDKVKGDLHSYNFKYLINLSRSDSEIKVWVENYWGSKDRCFEWLKENEKCGFEE